mgnify:CR=1 FL=1
MKIYTYQDDLQADVNPGRVVAIDTETMGLVTKRDRLCLVQISFGDDEAHLIQISSPIGQCPNLKKLFSNPEITKLFHFARFDLSVLTQSIGPIIGPVYCTKIASKLVRTYTDKHGLRDLCRELLKIDISKQQQSSDWGNIQLTEEQKVYAANDVLYLHQLKEQLDRMLERENRSEIANDCFNFLRTRVELDIGGFEDLDIFHH